MGLASGAFVTLAIVVVVVAMVFDLDMKKAVLGLGVVLALLIGIPAIRRSRAGKTEQDDEAETCEPIMTAFRKGKSVPKLLSDYDEWKRGDHATYTRMHFGAQVIDALRDAKRYEEALEVLYDLDKLPFKARERYDYDNYRGDCERQLLEGIQAEKRHAEERARNKNLRKKK